MSSRFSVAAAWVIALITFIAGALFALYRGVLEPIFAHGSSGCGGG
jgi:hypothetical protein